MAEVTVKVKLTRTFSVFCKGTNAEECLEDISDNDRLESMFDITDLYENMEIIEGTYDEPEPEDLEDDTESEN